MKVFFEEMQQVFRSILTKTGLSDEKSDLCATIFAENSRDGVYSHGLNRFPVFVKSIKEGLVDINAEPETVRRNGNFASWDGHFAPGMYTATLAIKEAINIAKENGIGA